MAGLQRTLSDPVRTHSRAPRCGPSSMDLYGDYLKKVQGKSAAAGTASDGAKKTTGTAGATAAWQRVVPVYQTRGSPAHA